MNGYVYIYKINTPIGLVIKLGKASDSPEKRMHSYAKQYWLQEETDTLHYMGVDNIELWEQRLHSGFEDNFFINIKSNIAGPKELFQSTKEIEYDHARELFNAIVVNNEKKKASINRYLKNSKDAEKIYNANELNPPGERIKSTQNDQTVVSEYPCEVVTPFAWIENKSKWSVDTGHSANLLAKTFLTFDNNRRERLDCEALAVINYHLRESMELVANETVYKKKELMEAAQKIRQRNTNKTFEKYLNFYTHLIDGNEEAAPKPHKGTDQGFQILATLVDFEKYFTSRKPKNFKDE